MKNSVIPSRLLLPALLLSFVFAASSLKAMDASPISPGVHLVERYTDVDLAEYLVDAATPIFSPDGNHLYFSRAADQELALLVALGIYDDGRPFFATSQSNTDPGFEGFSSISIRAFSNDGTRAYATAHRGEQSALVVLERTPASGALNVLQILDLGENERAASIQLTKNNQALYAAIPTLTPVTSPSHGGIIDYDTTAGRIMRFAIADDGRFADSVRFDLEGSTGAHQVRLLDSDSRLLVSTETTLTEYALSETTGELTSTMQTTTAPALERTSKPGLVDIVATSDGRFVYTILKQNSGSGQVGGYINAWSRDPASGSLQLVNQLVPTDFINNYFYRPYPAMLTPDENILLVPSFAGRFAGGSLNVYNSVNAFALDAQNGVVRATGKDSTLHSSGPGLAQQPDSNRFFSIYYDRGQFSFPPATAIGIFEPGRILEPTNLHAAVLPVSRSLSNRGAAGQELVTYFSTVLNPGDVDAEQCTVSSDESNHSLRFQITDPATDEPIDPDNFQRTFDVPANDAQTLLLTLDTYQDFAPTNIELEFKCLNAPLAPSLPGINSILMSASQQDLPDLITGAATIGNTGIVQLPSVDGLGVFAASTINIGGEDEIEAIPVLDLSAFVGDLAPLGETPDLNLRICETNPFTGECLSEPTDSVKRSIAKEEIVTYTVSVTGNGSDVAFAPGVNRVFIVLLDSTGEVRGASSVAVTTDPQP